MASSSFAYHSICSVVDCPLLDAKVYASSTSGNLCLQTFSTRFKFPYKDLIDPHCSNVCSREGCAAFITGDGKISTIYLTESSQLVT